MAHDEAKKQLELHARAFGLIRERAAWLAVATDERDTLNVATIIEHICEAVQGDEGAIASLRVLGIEWE
jgi:hypothetical protein